MKLRSKFILFFTFLMAILIASMIFYLNSYFKHYFKTSTLNNFQVLAELSEGSYLSFINTLKIRTVDWSSDRYIRKTVEDILKTPIKDRQLLVRELNEYLKSEKIIYNPNVLIIDILDKDGIVLASSRDNRLGVDEKKEELEKGVNKFSEAIKADFGQSFATAVVSEEDEHADPMIHITTRIFSAKTYSTGLLAPLDAVMIIHFINTERLRDILIGNLQKEKDKISINSLTEHYKTMDVYLVNKDRLMITPSRFGQDVILKQKVETEPVKACLEEGREIKGEYLDYQGKTVLGASMCLKTDGLVLILEAESQEIFTPIKDISQFLILIGLITSVLIFIGIIFLSNWLLSGLKMIINVAEKVSNNNFKERVRLNSKDEIGYLAKVFNRMLDSLEGHYKNIDAKEEELKKEVLFTRLLQKVSMLVNDVASIDNLVAKTVEEICRFLGWTVGHYYIFDEDSRQMKPSEFWYSAESAKYESFKKLIMGINFDSGDGFVGSAHETSLPTFVGDITKDNILAESGIKEISEVKSAFALPLIVNSQVVMVLDLYGDKTERMDEEVLKVLNNVAIQLGRAIEKNKVEDELKRNIAKGEITKVALYNILEDMKESENTIKREHHRMVAITSSVGEGLFVVDKDFKIILINPTAQRLLEVSEKEVVGKKIKDIVKVLKNGRELEGKEHLLTSVMKEEKTYTASPQDNISYQTLSGKIFPVTEVGTPLKDGIVGAVVVFKDITNEKVIDEARTNFVSTASHQLRTPLTSMKWISEMLANGDAGVLNDEQKNYVQNIYQSVERMIAVVNLLLQIARVEVGRLKIEPVAVDLRKVADEAIAVFKSTLESKLQKVEIITEPKNLPTVLMDKDVIDQVMQNLLSNAIRYTPISKIIRIFMIIKGENIEFSIKDNGIGIPKEQKSRVFEKFFRADNALKMVPEGSGLGLSLVKMLVDSWGGKIWFESEEGDGTAFFFTIPLDGMKPKKGEVKLTV